MDKIIDFVRSEPVAIAAFVSTVLALLVAFGAGLSEVQTGAIIAAVNAAIALITRKRVAPVRPEAGEAD